MNETLGLFVAGALGALLGGVFFGGLWHTVRRGVGSRHPGPWFLGSLLLRTGITLAGFFFVSRAHPGRLAACLIGFFVVHLSVTSGARALLSRPARPPPEPR